MRWIVRLLVLLFIIALLLAIFAPSILSTRFGNHILFRTLRNMSGYEIHAQELKLQWMKGQSASQIEVFDGTGRSVFRAESMTSTAPLWKLLFYHDVGHLQVQAPFIIIDPPRQLSKLVMQHASFLPIASISISTKMSVLGEISISQGMAEFVTPGLETISMKEIHLEAVLLPKQIKLQSSGITEEKSSQGTFQIDLLAYPGSNQIDANVVLAAFPLRAADQLVSIVYPHLKGVIREIIGESMNADLKIKNMQDSLELYLKAQSEVFSANLETKVQNDTLELVSPATLQFQIPPKSFEKLTSLSIKNGAALQLKMDKLSIPLQNHAQIYRERLGFANLDSAKRSQIEALRSERGCPSLNGKDDEEDRFGKVAASPISQNLSVRGINIQGTLRSDALQFDDWTLEPFSLYMGSSAAMQGEWSIKVDSPQVQFQGSLNLPEKWENLSFAGEALLPKNTKIDLSIKSLQSIAMIFQRDPWRGQFQGALDIVKKSLKGTLEMPALQVGNTQVGATSVQLTGDLKTKGVQFALTSTVDQGPLTASGTWTYPEELKMQGSCSKLPVEALAPFVQLGPPLLPLIGEFLTTNFQLQLSEGLRLLYLTASSPYLTLKAALKESDQRFELMEPASFTWTLTPQGYTELSKWLQGSPAYTLSGPAIFKGKVSTLSFASPQILGSLEYQGQITSDELSFQAGQQINKVSSIQVNLSHPSAASPHQFQIAATASPQGTLSCKGSWTPLGTAEIQLLLEQFPSATFDLFSAPFSTLSISTLCGPTLNLSLRTTLNQWNGPIQFEIHSANLRSALQGMFSHGTLTLSDTFHLQLDVTPPLSEMFFKQVNPLDVTSVRSEGPVTLEIDKQGFSYPVFPPNPTQVQIGSGRLELGKLLCHNEGNLQTTLGLLKLGQYRPGDELELWFAPLDFQIKNGVMSCERTEILIAKDFQVCLWGDVNFPNDSIDAILGLTASCLKNAFGIKNLPENYVLQIPLRGKLTDVKVDKGKATTRIGALMLWQQKGSVGGIVKGPAGKLLGETLNKLGPLPGGDQKAPPAKKPFPWDTEPTSKKKTSDTTPEHKALIHPEDSPLKQALKLLR